MPDSRDIGQMGFCLSFFDDKFTRQIAPRLTAGGVRLAAEGE